MNTVPSAQPTGPDPKGRAGTSDPVIPSTISRRSLLAGLGSIGFALVGAAACSNVSAPGGGGGSGTTGSGAATGSGGGTGSGTATGGGSSAAGSTAAGSGSGSSAAAGSSTPGSSAANAGAGKKVELTMFVFLGGVLGVMPKAFAADWQSSHPSVKINIYEESNQVGYPKMVARKATNPQSPLVNFGFFNANTTEQGIIDKMWRKLDYSSLSNAADIRDQFKRDDQYAIGIGADQIGMLFNADALGYSPTSWADLWDDKNKGKVTYFGFPWYAVFMAAKLNGGSLDNMDPGFTTLADHAANIRTIVTSNPQYQNVLSSGSAPLTAYFNGTGHQWIKGGAPLTYTPPKEGAVPVPVNLCVVDGQSEDQTAACMEALNEMISPKWCSQWADTSIEIPANEKSELSADLAKLPAFSEDTIKNLVDVDYAIVGKQTADWTDRWQREVVSKI
jgi:putative spermidine/putrescine transport system substrate-binding protein